MKTFGAILQLIGSITACLGALSVVNAMFDLGLTYKRTELPSDMAGALLILAIGLVFLGLAWAINRRKTVASQGKG
ncbi:MAG TPA: hypothetical protein VD886_02850 [Herpetosiphonaceae bacterium]|nr:hypothetical protein [Herpetosiphonaceae bacterium]